MARVEDWCFLLSGVRASDFRAGGWRRRCAVCSSSRLNDVPGRFGAGDLFWESVGSRTWGRSVLPGSGDKGGAQGVAIAGGCGGVVFGSVRCRPSLVSRVSQLAACGGGDFTRPELWSGLYPEWQRTSTDG